jgi:hypothetical protein
MVVKGVPCTVRKPWALTDTLWAMIAPGPKPIPHWPVFEGILWISWTGARWQNLTTTLPRLKKGAKVDKTKRAKGTKWMVVDGQSRPVGNFLAPVSSVEVALEAGDRRGKRCFATRKR